MAPEMGEWERQGKLKIFLGYAAGVGKTYQMLTETRHLRDLGHDVAIAYFEPHARKDTMALTEGLETIPRKQYTYRGATFEDMDTEGVIARKPEVAAVDEFAHTNVPGAPRAKRWEDVMAIRAAGIDVLTSMNVQHIESLNDQVWHITGIRVRETVPDWVVREAAEVVMVDVTPRALLHRLERGVVYAPEKARSAMEHFFTEANLTALRELAMRQAAHHLDAKIEAPHDPPPWLRGHAAEKILLWLTPDRSCAALIRRAWRVADYLGASCTAVYARSDSEGVEQWLKFCRELRIETSCLDGHDIPRAVVESARRRGITQIFVTRAAREVNLLVDLARDMQVTVVAERVREK
jgi:two-component system sensor histidine kinase KdpD